MGNTNVKSLDLFKTKYKLISEFPVMQGLSRISPDENLVASFVNIQQILQIYNISTKILRSYDLDTKFLDFMFHPLKKEIIILTPQKEDNQYLTFFDYEKSTKIDVKLENKNILYHSIIFSPNANYLILYNQFKIMCFNGVTDIDFKLKEPSIEKVYFVSNTELFIICKDKIYIFNIPRNKITTEYENKYDEIIPFHKRRSFICINKENQKIEVRNMDILTLEFEFDYLNLFEVDEIKLGKPMYEFSLLKNDRFFFISPIRMIDTDYYCIDLTNKNKCKLKQTDGFIYSSRINEEFLLTENNETGNIDMWIKS